MGYDPGMASPVKADGGVELPRGAMGAGKRKTDVLLTADRLIHGQRAQDYGDAKESFQNIAELWSYYLGHPVLAADVAVMMALLKVVRIKYSGHQDEDSFIDACGYIALAEYIASNRAEEHAHARE